MFSGTFRIPASKSHTIRQLLIAALAGGTSVIDYPLDSLDAGSCVAVCRGLGAVIEEQRATDPHCPNRAGHDGKKLIRYTVKGASAAAANTIANSDAAVFTAPVKLDVGNSGTTLYLALAAAALGSTPVEFDGDEQIRRRSAAPLLAALSGLGVRAESLDGSGCAPIIIQGPWKGGRVSISCPTSQYLSALLLAAPLAPKGAVTEIDVPLLNERPYIKLTLSYLDNQHIPYEAAADFSRFIIPGGASYKPLSGFVPGDFSSAAFPACAAAISGGPVTILGLDPDDNQGDKAIFDILAKMGCLIEWKKQAALTAKDSALAANTAQTEWALTISRSGPLHGGVFDLNATPDLLPAVAVTAAFAETDTSLVNVAHARIKETDRIAVMAEELKKPGVKTEERPDGIIIHGTGEKPKGALINGRGDHRIVMAFAALGLGAEGPVKIDSAESAAVTYPGFLELLNAEIKE
jgi:3-phosphoshikimate 1-carboxyvinyltransferase